MGLLVSIKLKQFSTLSTVCTACLLTSLVPTENPNRN